MRPIISVCIAAALHLALLVAGALAQAPSADNCTRRTVLASVVTETGEPVADVPASRFYGTFRGKPVGILSATRDLTPKRVVVLLDASASMTEGDSFGPPVTKPMAKWEFARRAVNDVLRGLPAQDEVALLVFASKVEIEVPFASGRRAIADKIAELADGGKAIPKKERRTALLDTILVALKLFEPSREGDAIYLITDGDDNASRAGPREVEDALLAAGVRVFAMGLADSEWAGRATPEEMAGPPLLAELPEQTGGLLLQINSYLLSEKQAAALSLNVRFLYIRMIAPYRLEIDLPEPIEKPGKWKLELVDEKGKEEKRWKAAYARTLMPCK